LSLSADGSQLAAASREAKKVPGLVEVWNVKTGQCVHVFHGHSDVVQCLALSGDNRYLASGGPDKLVILWDLATGKELFTFRGHTAAVSTLEFSPDGQRLVSSSGDGTLKIWDARPLED
jgi:WD40 repeat protein